MAKSLKPPAELTRRNPLITRAGVRLLEKLRQHPDAPRWTSAAGDRIDRDDRRALRAYARELRTARERREPGELPGAVVRRVASLRDRVVGFRARLPRGVDLLRVWPEIPTVSREDIAVRLEEQVPLDADLDRLIVFTTAGTTGHPLHVPHDPRATGAYLPLLEFALERHGVALEFRPASIACFLVGAQARTVTYPTVLSYWGGAGFAKLNLRSSEWPTPASPRRYFAAFAPQFLTGDPISFAEMMRSDIKVKPAALVSTAVAMSRGLKGRLRRKYRCPVIDWYSLTETGPIGYACPKGRGYHLLSHDLYVEAVDESGRPVPDGCRGEITVTGGRNPFLPLLRYRTGDWGRIDHRACSCGDPMPKIRDLEGRAPVLFRARDGQVVNPVDLSAVLRRFPLVQHELTQREDLSCELVLRPIGGPASLDRARIRAGLRALLGAQAKISIKVDPKLGDRRPGGKVTPYQSDLLLED